MASSERSRLSRVLGVGVWVLTTFDVLLMTLAGLGKFHNDVWSELFLEWGYPDGFFYLIGALEVGGAILLLIPRFTSYAAGLLIVIMLGALVTVLTHEGRMGPGMPTIHIVILSILLAARWKRRWRPSGPSAGAAAGTEVSQAPA